MWPLQVGAVTEMLPPASSRYLVPNLSHAQLLPSLDRFNVLRTFLCLLNSQGHSPDHGLISTHLLSTSQKLHLDRAPSPGNGYFLPLPHLLCDPQPGWPRLSYLRDRSNSIPPPG